MPTTACKLPVDLYIYVEGDMERSALKCHFGVKAAKIGINGKSVQMSAIARNLSTDLMRFSQNSKIIIVFDRETRTESCEELGEELSTLLKRDFPDMSFCIGIPDRDMEAWLFADRELVAKHFRKPVGRRSRFEGEVGAQSIKKHIGPGKYDKMTDGVALFGKAKWKTIHQNSRSAQLFKIADFLPGCGWLT